MQWLRQDIWQKILCFGYIKKNPVCTEEEVEEIVNEYDKINALGIPAYNYMLMLNCFKKIIIYVFITFM